MECVNCRILYPQGRKDAASPRASSALRIQSRRTNRGRSPRYGICKQRLNRRPRRPRGSPQTEGRQGIRSGWGCRTMRHRSGWFLPPDSPSRREIGPLSRESSATSRGDDEAHGCTMMPRLEEDSAAKAGRVATRRLDADDRDRISTVSIDPGNQCPPRQDRGRHAATGSGFRVKPAAREPPAKRLVLWGGRVTLNSGLSGLDGGPLCGGEY